VEIEMSDTKGRSGAAADRTAAAQHGGRSAVRVYEHSDLLYWWIVWLYGFGCAGVTRAFGEGTLIAEKALYVHPSPWLGLSYVALVLFVLVVTHLRARGQQILIFALLAIIIVGGTYFTIGWAYLFAQLSLLKVHMNMAFYLTMSLVLFVVWVLSCFVFNYFSYWEFSHQIVHVHWGTRTVYAPIAPQVHSVAADLFVHRLLGLSVLGYGTGDLDVAFGTSKGQQHFLLENVWKADEKEKQITKLLDLVNINIQQGRNDG
jgi:hypothetical protein